MNILFVIGNGFDLAQGLNTRYSDFYPYYLQCKSPNNASKLLKENIKENIGDWSDMELALGDFSRNVKSDEEFAELYFDLSDRLADYLKQEFESKQFNEKDQLLMDLFQPFNYLEPLDRRLYLKHFNLFASKSNDVVDVNVVTLNYTTTLESLIGNPSRANTVLNKTYYSLRNICHLHGVLGDTILIGVNDESQIANESFKQNLAIRDYLVKPEAIASMRSDRSLLCHDYVDKANIIVLFGVSLGATDANLWKMIVRRLATDSALLVYFHYSSEIIPSNRKQLLGRKEAQAREYLYRQLMIPENLQSQEKILIGYNKDIFKIKKL